MALIYDAKFRFHNFEKKSFSLWVVCQIYIDDIYMSTGTSVVVTGSTRKTLNWISFIGVEFYRNYKYSTWNTVFQVLPVF